MAGPTTNATAHQDPKIPIAGVSHVLAVASGKGGVGKSTVAVNLALALKASGCQVGLLDADIYGPSSPVMLGSRGRPELTGSEKMSPVHQHGIKMISMGLFLSDKMPVMWRGPIAISVTKQLLRGVEWGILDYLLVDLPPGTGDIALTLAQEVPLSGGIVVTTPQDVALADVQRGAAMLNRLGAPVLGIIQNMSAFVCTNCGAPDEVFGARSQEDLEERLGAPLLADVPLVEEMCRCGDQGAPLVATEPDHPVSTLFLAAATRVRAVLEGR